MKDEYIGKELDKPVSDGSSPPEADSEIVDDEANALCWLTINGNRTSFSPGARVCWGGNVIICQSNGQWHNSRKSC